VLNRQIKKERGPPRQNYTKRWMTALERYCLELEEN
jgi:hypothetical protein